MSHEHNPRCHGAVDCAEIGDDKVVLDTVGQEFVLCKYRESI